MWRTVGNFLLSILGNLYAFVIVLISSITAGWYANYLNSIIPKPETFVIFVKYLISDHKLYATTALVDLLAGTSIAILGMQLIHFGVSFMFRKYSYYDSETIFQNATIWEKIGICLIILVGLTLFLYSFVFTGYFFTLLFVAAVVIGAIFIVVKLFATSK